MLLHNNKRLVIKIGSQLLIDEHHHDIRVNWLKSIIADVAELAHQGISLIIVTSGASACGHLSLELKRQESSLNQQQAAAAVGQIQLMQLYQSLLAEHALQAGQVLLSLTDIENRRHYVNLRNTFESLLKLNVIPIINENDSVATAELRYGDNDRLSARVAQMVEADSLILLSDVDGLYTTDPRRDRQAQFIPEVPQITSDIKKSAQKSSTSYGTGGMVTKLAAAEIATAGGCGLLIIKGEHDHPLRHYMKTRRGTWFPPSPRRKSARHVWLSQHQRPSGAIEIDKGAGEALKKGKSLLPVGIKTVQGHFNKGDTLQITCENNVFARGLSNYTDGELQKIKGKNSYYITELLGYAGCDEAIHRNNMVLI